MERSSTPTYHIESIEDVQLTDEACAIVSAKRGRLHHPVTYLPDHPLDAMRWLDGYHLYWAIGDGYDSFELLCKWTGYGEDVSPAKFDQKVRLITSEGHQR